MPAFVDLYFDPVSRALICCAACCFVFASANFVTNWPPALQFPLLGVLRLMVLRPENAAFYKSQQEQLVKRLLSFLPSEGAAAKTVPRICVCCCCLFACSVPVVLLRVVCELNQSNQHRSISWSSRVCTLFLCVRAGNAVGECGGQITDVHPRFSCMCCVYSRLFTHLSFYGLSPQVTSLVLLMPSWSSFVAAVVAGSVFVLLARSLLRKFAGYSSDDLRTDSSAMSNQGELQKDEGMGDCCSSNPHTKHTQLRAAQRQIAAVAGFSSCPSSKFVDLRLSSLFRVQPQWSPARFRCLVFLDVSFDPESGELLRLQVLTLSGLQQKPSQGQQRYAPNEDSNISIYIDDSCHSTSAASNSLDAGTSTSESPCHIAQWCSRRYPSVLPEGTVRVPLSSGWASLLQHLREQCRINLDGEHDTAVVLWDAMDLRRLADKLEASKGGAGNMPLPGLFTRFFSLRATLPLCTSVDSARALLFEIEAMPKVKRSDLHLMESLMTVMYLSVYQDFEVNTQDSLGWATLLALPTTSVSAASDDAAPLNPAATSNSSSSSSFLPSHLVVISYDGGMIGSILGKAGEHVFPALFSLAILETASQQVCARLRWDLTHVVEAHGTSGKDQYRFRLNTHVQHQQPHTFDNLSLYQCFGHVDAILDVFGLLTPPTVASSVRWMHTFDTTAVHAASSSSFHFITAGPKSIRELNDALSLFVGIGTPDELLLSPALFTSEIDLLKHTALLYGGLSGAEVMARNEELRQGSLHDKSLMCTCSAHTLGDPSSSVCMLVAASLHLLRRDAALFSQATDWFHLNVGKAMGRGMLYRTGAGAPLHGRAFKDAAGTTPVGPVAKDWMDVYKKYKSATDAAAKLNSVHDYASASARVHHLQQALTYRKIIAGPKYETAPQAHYVRDDRAAAGAPLVPRSLQQDLDSQKGHQQQVDALKNAVNKAIIKQAQIAADK